MWTKFVLFLVLALLTVGICENIFAESFSNGTVADVSLQLHNISHSDLKDFSFDIAFSMLLQFNDHGTKEPLIILPINSGEVQISNTIQLDSNNYLYKIFGHFDSTANLYYFPFYDQIIMIEMYFPYPQEKIKFTSLTVPSYENSTTIVLSGWEIVDSSSIIADYELFGQKFTKYSAEFLLKNTSIAMYAQLGFPIVIFGLIGYVSLFFSQERNSVRINLLSSGLVSFIFYNALILDTIPSVGYIILLNSTAYSIYIMYFICLVPSILQKYNVTHDKMFWLIRLYRVVCPILFIIIMLIFEIKSTEINNISLF